MGEDRAGKGGSAGCGEITQLLQAWQRGSSEAQDKLWAIVYKDLKFLARRVLRSRRPVSRADATSLVHKAYLRLLNSEVDWNDRRHFFAIAARAMRFLLADEARRQLSLKRGAGALVAHDREWPEVADTSSRYPEEVLAIHELLDQLMAIRPRYERLVELRYFAGMSVEEAAGVLQVTPRTVVRDWRAIRIWLHDKLTDPR